MKETEQRLLFMKEANLLRQLKGTVVTLLFRSLSSWPTHTWIFQWYHSIGWLCTIMFISWSIKECYVSCCRFLLFYFQTWKSCNLIKSWICSSFLVFVICILHWGWMGWQGLSYKHCARLMMFIMLESSVGCDMSGARLCALLVHDGNVVFSEVCC